MGKNPVLCTAPPAEPGHPGHAEIVNGAELEVPAGIQATNHRTQTIARPGGWFEEYRYIDGDGNSRVRVTPLVATSTNLAASIGIQITGVDFLPAP